MRIVVKLLLAAAAVSVSCSSGAATLVLPEVVAQSQYVDYGAWADVSYVCMGEKLKDWDAYIVDISAFMGVEILDGRIRYSFVPEQAKDDTNWPCSSGAGGCARPVAGEYQALVFTNNVESLHELVHAVELPALGATHHVLSEGMAEYLSEGSSTQAVLSDFAQKFLEEMDELKVSAIYYRRCMHFVGSLIEGGGVRKFYEFRSLLKPDSKLVNFEEAYLKVYGGDFRAALAAMESLPITGRWQPWGCEDSSTALPWSNSESLDVKLAGRCGRGSFYGGGVVDDEPAFSEIFTLDVPRSGVYEISLISGDELDKALGDVSAEIVSCPGTNYSGTLLFGGQNHQGILWEGRHQLRVDYAFDRNRVGSAQLKAEFVVEAFP